MNYSKQILEMLGVEPDEAFELTGCSGFIKLDKNLIPYKFDEISGNWYPQDFSGGLLKYILLGVGEIIKHPKKITLTKEEQIGIDYARACGFRWLAKDDGAIYATAYSNKPFKGDRDGVWSYNGKPCMMIEIPMSFISWEDAEPYYIGSEEE